MNGQHNRGSEPAGGHVSERWARWRDEIDLEEYDTRWERRAEAGHQIHGEADLVMSFEPRSALDAGCGMGRVAIELARRGCDVVGVDLDGDLLAFARRRAPDLAWHCADLATLDLMPARMSGPGRGFDAVVLAGNVVNFCRPEVRVDIVARLAAHLEPGGRLIAGFAVEPEPDAGRSDSGGAPATNADHHIGACAAAGLTPEHRWSSWDRDPFAPDAGYALFVDRRPPLDESSITR